MNRVLVCGDRNWTDVKKIRERLVSFSKDTVVIHGGARGADTIAGVIAHELGIKVLEFRADWTHYGRAAGPIRNQVMLTEGKPNLVIACHSDLDKSRGTADMVRRARKAGVRVEVIT